MAKIIGIDLGTSNSAAAVVMGGKPTIIPAAEGATVGGKAFPSVVAFSKDGELLVGEPARRQAVTNPDNTIIAAKRKMGSEHTFKIQDKEYKPQQISAFILQKIKKDSEAFIGEPVKKAVITVPAYFDDNQRQATKDAGTIAGLDVVRIINEPTAASLAFGLDKAKEDMKILVFDFGGGTLDVTIMEMGGGVFEVLSTSGDTQLGGTDMDKVLIDYVVDEFKKKEGIDLLQDTTATTRIREAAEKAKIELSTVMETDVNLPFIAQDPSTGAKNLELRITRAKLDELIAPIVERCKPSIVKAFEDAKLSHSDISKIVMIGGPTRMPFVRKIVGEIVGKEPESGVDPMEAVAMGAAIQAGIIAGDVTSDIVLLDVTPLTLGIETLGGVREPLIERNTTIPTSKSKVFTTAADNQTAVTIHVVQGERPMATDNVSLGSFNLTDLPPAPRGIPQIDVKFDIDANGIINVTAKDLGTQKEAKITIESSSKLSKEEIEKLKEDAEKFSDEDKKKKEKIDLKNEAESYIYTTEKLVNHDLKDKISQEQGIKITDAVKEVKEVLDKEPDELKPKLEALQSIVNKVTTELYKNASPPPGTEGQQGTGTEGQQGTGTEGQQGTGTEGQQGTGTEGQQGTGTEGQQGTGTEGQQGTGTEGQQGTGTEGQQGTGTEGQQGTGTEGQQGTGTEGQQGTGTEGQQGTGTEGQQGTGTEGQQGTDADNQTTESSSTDETKTD